MTNLFQDITLYDEIIVDDELTLRQISPDEASIVFNLIDNNREYLGKWLPWVDSTASPADSLLFIKGVMQKRVNRTDYGFGIYLNGTLLGHISLMHIIEGEPEIGYWIDSSASGKGITTKAAQAITDFGFNILGVEKIIIRANINNTASNRIAQKLGYINTKSYIDDKNCTLNVWEIKRNNL